MPRECSALELRALMALLSAPANTLTEGALGKAIGRAPKTAREALLQSLQVRGDITIEAGRRGRRVRLTDRGRVELAQVRVPPRARLSGALVNALLEQLGSAHSSAPRLPLTREKILAAHAQLARGPGGTVELAALREALPGSREDELETILVQLDREGIVRLSPAVDLALLDERLKSAAIDDPLRGPLVYVSRSQTSHAETTP